MNTAPARYTLAELSERFNLQLHGDGRHEIGRVGTLQDAGTDAITFLANPAYRDEVRCTAAGAVIVKAEDAELGDGNRLVADDPYIAYARVATLFDHRPVAPPGVHPSAVIDASAQLGADVHVGPGAVIGADCDIGDGCSIGPGCAVADGCRMGAGSRLAANVSLCDGVRLGMRVIVHPGAVIGADGFGIAHAGDHWEKVPQLGSVIVGDDCEIGANSCIDRGAIGNTVLEEDVRIDNLCQIGHNCHIGAHTAMAAFTGLAGSTRIGRNCLFGGRSGATGHLEIADGVTVTATTTVTKSIKEAGTTWGGGIPAQQIREWHRTLGHLRRMEGTIRRMRDIEKQNRKKDD